jgi:ribosomal protein S12 methylthiotransferase accessory factor
MEAIELGVAEEASTVSLPTVELATASQLGRSCEVRVQALSHPALRGVAHAVEMEWVEATEILTGDTQLIPLAAIALDLSIPRRFPDIVRQTSTGLASGNSPGEATLHGLMECIERECTEHFRLLSRSERAGRLTAFVSDEFNEIIENATRHGIVISCHDITLFRDFPAYRVGFSSPDLMATFCGYGCHPIPSIAFSRAFTEAAQSRLTAIAGARDDVNIRAVDSPTFDERLPTAVSLSRVDDGNTMNLDVPTQVRRAAEIVEGYTGIQPTVSALLIAELSVCRVVCPGLRVPED